MPNKYKVPKKQWRKWSITARGVFNQHFEELRDGLYTPLAPCIKGIPSRSWRILAWNAAWLAADAVDEVRRSIPRVVLASER